MNHKLYKRFFTYISIGFFGTFFAQKFDKKYTENFKTNKDVEIAINASNTVINVTSWNKNEVQIEAFIEIEGVIKEEAEKYIKNWGFEALGNSGKVQITSKVNNSFNFKNDFVFFDNMNFDFQMPEIDMSNIEAIVLPDMDFDFDLDMDFDFAIDDVFYLSEDISVKKNKNEDTNDNESWEFTFKDNEGKVKIKSKKEWEKFKKTERYQKFENKLAEKKETLRKRFKENKAKIRIAYESANKKKAMNKEMIEEAVENARKRLKELNFHLSSDRKSLTTDGKKIKINKRLEIKVPKGATFDLNTRHCKVKLANTVAYGNVKYGTFNANNLNGGKLTIEYSPVTINDLNACTLFLNNVTDAKIASVTNTKVNANSSGVFINLINDNVDIKTKLGDLEITKFVPNFNSFNLSLDSSSAILNFTNLKEKLNFSATSLNTTSKLNNTTFQGVISLKTNRISINGKNSKLTVIK